MDIPSWLVLFFFSCIFIYYSSLGRIGRNKSSNLPPGPLRLPIIGNLHQVIGENFHQIVWKISQKYGPIMLLHLGAKPFVIISSSELATQVLKTHDQKLLDRPFNRNLKQISFNYNDIAFSSHGDHWRQMRKVLVTELIGSKRSRLLKSVVDIEINSLLASLSISSGSGTIVNIDEKITNLVIDIMSKVAMGKSYREEIFRGKTLKEMLEELGSLLPGSFSDIFPKKLGWFLDEVSGINGRLNKTFSTFNGFLEMILDEHIDHTNEDEKDLIDACRSQLTREEMKALLVNVFFGGIDTTSITMVWGMSEIVKNPRVMQKLQDEIRSVIGKKSRVDESDIEKMTYFKMVMKETLRLHAAAPFLFTKECTDHIQIGGYDIVPGTRVLVSSWAIARDPKIWTENANEFYPERFENVVLQLDQFDMIPFGGGRRSCPGYNLATFLDEFTLVNLLYWFDWKTPTGLNNHDLNMEEKGDLLVGRKTPLCLVPIKHNWQD